MCMIVFLRIMYIGISVLSFITLYISMLCERMSVRTFPALLNITPSANNGTFGALHHMLKPAVADTLPPGTVYIIHV